MESTSQFRMPFLSLPPADALSSRRVANSSFAFGDHSLSINAVKRLPLLRKGITCTADNGSILNSKPSNVVLSSPSCTIPIEALTSLPIESPETEPTSESQSSINEELPTVSYEDLQYESGFLGAVPDKTKCSSDSSQMTMDYLCKILKSRVYDVAIESPLELANKLSQRMKNNIYLKREDMQQVPRPSSFFLSPSHLYFLSDSLLTPPFPSPLPSRCFPSS